MGISIKNIEYYLPENIITNEDLKIENPDWDMEKVFAKTGVYKRHISRIDETAFDLSVKACEKLFIKIDKDIIDAIICCTQSPDYIMPSNAFLLQKHFKLSKNIFAFDFNHACTGFVYGLLIAESFINSGLAKNILLINADTYSKYINKKDRSTRVLFGDGAAATLISRNEKKGIIDKSVITVGKEFEKFWIPAGGLRIPKDESTTKEIKENNGNVRSKNNINMDGMGVWSFINGTVPKQINDLLIKNKLTISDINMFLFHQASKMTLDSLIKKLKIPESKTYLNLLNIGNTVSASIPIALKDTIDAHKIANNQLLVIAGFGVGLSSGVILMET